MKLLGIRILPTAACVLILTLAPEPVRAANETAEVGTFDVWSIASDAEPLIGKAADIKVHVKLTTYTGHKPRFHADPRNAEKSDLAINVAHTVLQGAFQQSILNASALVLKTLGYMANATLKAKKGELKAWGEVNPRKAKRPGQIRVHLPDNQAIITLKFVDKPPDQKGKDLLKMTR